MLNDQLFRSGRNIGMNKNPDSGHTNSTSIENPTSLIYLDPCYSLNILNLTYHFAKLQSL